MTQSKSLGTSHSVALIGISARVVKTCKNNNSNSILGGHRAVHAICSATPILRLPIIDHITETHTCILRAVFSESYVVSPCPQFSIAANLRIVRCTFTVDRDVIWQYKYTYFTCIYSRRISSVSACVVVQLAALLCVSLDTFHPIIPSKCHIISFCWTEHHSLRLHMRYGLINQSAGCPNPFPPAQGTRIHTDGTQGTVFCSGIPRATRDQY